jgi:hypothetical protein
MEIVILARCVIRNNAMWRPYKSSGLHMKVHPSEQVCELINFMDWCSMSFHQFEGNLAYFKTMFIIWRPGIGKVHLDPYKTWEEQGIQDGDCVYRFKPSRLGPAGAA